MNQELANEERRAPETKVSKYLLIIELYIDV